MKLIGAEIIATVLVEHNVDTVFGYLRRNGRGEDDPAVLYHCRRGFVAGGFNAEYIQKNHSSRLKFFIIISASSTG